MPKLAKPGDTVRVLRNVIGAHKSGTKLLLKTGDVVKVRFATSDYYFYECDGQDTINFTAEGTTRLKNTNQMYINDCELLVKCKFLNIEKIESLLNIENNSFVRTII